LGFVELLSRGEVESKWADARAETRTVVGSSSFLSEKRW